MTTVTLFDEWRAINRRLEQAIAEADAELRDAGRVNGIFRAYVINAKLLDDHEKQARERRRQATRK